MAALLQDWLLEERVLSEATIRKAVDRQSVYGGSLDTAILEIDAMTEEALWTRLAAATGLPPPEPDLYAEPLPGDAPILAAERTRPLRAVPVKIEDGILKVLCAEPVAADDIRVAAAERGLTAQLYVVPEVRLFVARQSVYGEPLPARYAPLWARIRGTARAARSPADGPARGGASVHPTPRPTTTPVTAVATLGEVSPGTAGTPAAQAAAATPAPRPAEPPAPQAAAATPAPRPAEPIAEPAAPVSPSQAAAVPPPPAAQEAEPPTLPAALPSATLPPEEQTARTPLEYFLDLSSRAPPEPQEEQHDLDEDVGAQPTMPMGDPSSGLVALEVPPTPTVPTEPTSRLGQSLLDFGLSIHRDNAFDPGDAGTEALCRRARDSGDKGRTLALRALRGRLTQPAVQDLLAELRVTASRDADPVRAIWAIEALEELRDAAMLPLLIERLDDAISEEVVEAAHRALVALAAQDFGRSRRRWLSWAQSQGRRDRVYWLVDGLDHKDAEIRKAASEELRHLSGDSFGYVFDAPRDERDAARRRWSSWAESLAREPNQAPSRPTD